METRKPPATLNFTLLVGSPGSIHGSYLRHLNITHLDKEEVAQVQEMLPKCPGQPYLPQNAFSTILLAGMPTSALNLMQATTKFAISLKEEEQRVFLRCLRELPPTEKVVRKEMMLRTLTSFLHTAQLKDEQLFMREILNTRAAGGIVLHDTGCQLYRTGEVCSCFPVCE